MGVPGYFETIQLSGGKRRLFDSVSTESAFDRFFENNADWLPFGLVSYEEYDVYYVNDASISISAQDRRDGSLLDRGGTVVIDAVVVERTSVWNPYYEVGPDNMDPTAGGDVLFMVGNGEPRFLGATVFPVGTVRSWVPWSQPTIGTAPWLTLTPMGSYE